jgi:hypothetical protein
MTESPQSEAATAALKAATASGVSAAAIPARRTGTASFCCSAGLYRA